MDRDELKSYIEENFINKNGKLSPWVSRKDYFKNKDILHIEDAIYNHTYFLKEDAPLAARIHCVRHDITEQPICACCGAPTNYFKEYKDFAKTCGNRTCASDESKERRMETNRARYGIDYNFMTEEAREKSLANAHTDEAKAKRIQTNIEKYGVDNPSKSNVIKNKIRDNTPRDAMGRHHTQRVYGADVWAKLNDPSFWWCEHLTNQRPIMDIAREFGITVSQACGLYRNVTGEDPQRHPTTYAEVQISDFLCNLGLTGIAYNNRSVIDGELDAYIPSRNIAIEHNGVYWHSDRFVGASYHLDKTEQCDALGIKLFHIFEDEWIHKQDIWKSIIRNAVGKTPQRHYARKCECVVLSDSRVIQEFLIKNHLQGYNTNSSLAYGLICDGELVSIMTFGKPRFNKNYEWELHRFCNTIDTHVVGGASKLYKKFVHDTKPSNILSYADRRYSSGGLYQCLGMELSHMTRPNYYYIHSKCTDRFSRMKFQKHKLANLLDKFDPELSERENMIANGYYRIYDCGNLVFTKSFY